MGIVEILSSIQARLKSPKNQKNKFGNYNYRSCEDILEAAKPLLAEHSCAIVINDEMVLIGDRYYVKATASLMCGDTRIDNTAYARESLDKKGMDDAQVTGSTSSYARKYALNGLFAIDDTKDSDTDEHAAEGRGKERKEAQKNKPAEPMTDAQRKTLMPYYKGMSEEDRLHHATTFFKRDINSFNELSKDEASRLIDAWVKYAQERSNAQ